MWEPGKSMAACLAAIFGSADPTKYPQVLVEQFTAFFAKSKTHHAAAAHLCLGWSKCDERTEEVEGIPQLQVFTQNLRKET